MHDELLEAILHSYRSLRDEITKLRNEISHTKKDLEAIKTLLKEKPCKLNRKDELKTPNELSITTQSNSKQQNKISSEQPNLHIYKQSTPEHINKQSAHILNLPPLNQIFKELETRINNKATLNQKRTL